MAPDYVRIQSYAPLTNAIQDRIDDVDIDVALSNVVC